MRRSLTTILSIVLVALGWAPLGASFAATRPVSTTAPHAYDSSSNTSVSTFVTAVASANVGSLREQLLVSRPGEFSLAPIEFVAADTATSVVEAGGYTNADLEASANAMDRNGLTRAGRALQKHGDRPGSVFPRSTGSAEARNAQGIDQVNAILNDPNRTVDVLNKVINIYGSNGAGVRYSVGGDFMGFLEP